MRRTFEMFRQHTLDSKKHREDTMRFVVMRMRHGQLHVFFHAWLEILPAQRAAQADDEDGGPVVAALRTEVSELRSQLAAVSKALAMQERSKAYRYEVVRMRDELHSFLFQNAPPPEEVLAAYAQRQSVATIVTSHSQSDDSDEEADASEPPASRAVGMRPRSGGPTGRPSLSARPSSARADVRFAVPDTPAGHSWPIKEHRPSLIVPADAAIVPAVPLRARPPNSPRPSTSDRRSPRYRAISGGAAEPDPLFTCESIGGANSAASGAGLAWSKRDHFSSVLPPISGERAVLSSAGLA